MGVSTLKARPLPEKDALITTHSPKYPCSGAKKRIMEMERTDQKSDQGHATLLPFVRNTLSTTDMVTRSSL